jgi:phage terminase small subunit
VKTLTAKQQAFVMEYIVDLNATQAAIRAGYKPRSARFVAAQNLSKLNVAAAIAEAKAARAERVAVTQDEVIAGLYSEANRVGRGASHAARVQAWTQLGKHLGICRSPRGFKYVARQVYAGAWPWRR